MMMESFRVKNYLFPLIYSLVFVQLTVQQQYSDQKSQPPPQPTYACAVSELMTSSGQNHDTITEIHTGNIVSAITSNEIENAEISVYPEGALNTPHNSIEVPLPEQNVVPCDSGDRYSSVLRNISCAVKGVRKFVVINLYMQTNCSEEAAATNDTRPCTRPKENINVYSTSVVFDRNGAIIARYRKFNVLNQTLIRATLEPDVVSFQTDFGVRFGLLTSMDIFFENPARLLLTQGVRHFILPSMWTPELPFLTANQMQFAWSYANNVTLLASGRSLPFEGNTGTGIYSGSIGALAVVMSEVYLTKILQANLTHLPGVPRDTDKPVEESSYAEEQSRNFRVFSENLNDYGVELLPLAANGTQIGRRCSGSFCCSYNILATDLGSMENSVFYRYALVYFNGTREHGSLPNFHTGITACAVVACTEDDRSSCNTRFVRDTPNVYNRFRFDRLELAADYPQFTYNRSTVMPSTLTAALLPFALNGFTYQAEPVEQAVRVSMSLSRPNSNFLTFGVYSRDYALDRTSGANKAMSTVVLVIIGFVLNYICY